MKLDWLHHRARQIVDATLREEDEDLDRMLVGDALVVRQGTHYRIESGGDRWEDLEARARELFGECRCGEILASRAGVSYCRRCDRTATRH